ncbi:MAG: hypothetical protein IT379_15970 [Deltaproteobacteria bacterium]|nr:hypothetical protein [Deltaproteobacteria bacterium]
MAVLEADGVRRFMQGRQGIPTSARFVVTEGPDGGTNVDGIGWYDNAAQAQAARDYWEARRLQFVQNDLNRLFFGSLVLALRGVRISAHGSSVHVLANVRRNEARRLMRLAQRIFVARGRDSADGGVEGGARARPGETGLDGGTAGPAERPASPESTTTEDAPRNPWPSLRPRVEADAGP